MKKNVKLMMTAIVVLAVVAIIGYGKHKAGEDAFLAASYVITGADNFIGTKGIVEAASYYGNEYMEDEEKVILLEDVAQALGITEGLVFSSVRENGRETITLTKDGVYSDTTLSLVTLEEQDDFGIYSFAQYFVCRINIDDSPESVCYYARILKSYLDEKGLTDDVTSTLISYFDGEFDVAKSSELADEVLDRMDAGIVAENRTKELFSVYAYTEDIDAETAVSLGSVKTNVNIAVNYNERENQTRVYLAAPILDIEY